MSEDRDRNLREEAIVEAARLLSGEQRAAYLDRMCGKSGLDRGRVESLLRGEDEGATLHEAQEETSATVASPQPEQAGDRIGPYKLLQQLGEGGCGVVYMAEQEHPVRRRIALKVIKLGMDTRSVIARFEAERQALALMDHPNIAKVLDAGATATGRPFFVMELVRGIRITDYCDQNHLGVRQRLELFTQVCHAIQHAHQKGVIHRDIKPSNILVALHDGVPVPKVIDFGIAKATDQRLTDKTLFTQFEQIVGTPAYMSPEQAEMSGLDVDTRSDIYSLGVLLYELLTGRTPFDPKELMQSGLNQMRQTIREREPQRPSTRLTTLTAADLAATAQRHGADPPKLIHLIRGDLDWIVMKTLEKDRTRRYETANGLALDVQRFLSSEPISARPPSTLYRFQKMARKHKTTFAASAAVLAALLIGFTVCLYLFIQEREARRRAVAAEKEQARMREKAEAVATLEANLRKQAQAGEKYTRAGLLLSKGQLEEAEGLLKDLPPSPDAVSFYNAFSRIHAQRGDWAVALSNCTLLANFCTATNSPLSEAMPAVYHALLPLLVQNGQLDQYGEVRRRVIQQFGTDPDPVTSERMAKDCLFIPPEPSQTETLNAMADRAVAAGPAHRSWVYFQFAKGLAEYRRGHFQEATDWLQKVVGQTNDSKRTVQALMTLAMVQHRMGQTEQAGKAYDEGMALAKRRLPEITRNSTEEEWMDWIIARQLCREASELIQPGTANHGQPK